MKISMPSCSAIATMLLAAIALSPARTAAQTASDHPESGDWQFTATIHAYLQDLTGRVNFPGDGGSTDIDLPLGDILDHLKMTFMGAVEAHNGR